MSDTSTPAPTRRVPLDAYPHPAKRPTQEGPHGIRYDFNDGCRVSLPTPAEGCEWRITMADDDAGTTLFDTSVSTPSTACSNARWFIRHRIRIVERTTGGQPTGREFEHLYDATAKTVTIHLPTGTLGDSIAWFAYAARFRDAHGCRLRVTMAEPLTELLTDAFEGIEVVSNEAAKNESFASESYATYCIGLFFNDAARHFQPTDFRTVGLHRTAGHILGLDASTSQDPEPYLTRLAADTEPPIEGRYVCIAVQATTASKMWNLPGGWIELIAWLKNQGIEAVCIDMHRATGNGLAHMSIPHGCRDETGRRSLTERARWLRHAEGFIGLSSGLSWLAWALGKPVVLISGFTHPLNEFHTPYRVINWHGCNSCWNDTAIQFDHHDFVWCPRHAGTPRQIECTRLISTKAVISAARRMINDSRKHSRRQGDPT